MKFREFIKKNLKDTDAWSEVLFFYIFSLPLAFIIHKISKNKSLPYLLTFLSFALRAYGGILFFYQNILMGVLFNILGFIIDDVDGQVSRAIFGKDPNMRGTLDFLLDFVSMVIVFVGLGSLVLLKSPDLSILYIFYLASFIFFMALTSTKFRIYSLQKIDPDKTLLSTGKIKGRLRSFINNIQKRFQKFHLVMHPSIVDSLFILFIIFPLVNFNIWLLITAIIFIWIDILITGIVPVYFLLKSDGNG
ncbi:CDP-alcohol phosphatidyltransferase family protein [Candidatus Woesearchaeota archaeon]|nr:CDP-alcohol phosphatidyltransferase family protein [Candidatus Woesearchaeota archaeon]